MKEGTPRPGFALQAPAAPAKPPAVPEQLADDMTVDLPAERSLAGVDEIIEALRWSA
jgi:hypothetical protein